MNVCSAEGKIAPKRCVKDFVARETGTAPAGRRNSLRQRSRSVRTGRRKNQAIQQVAASNAINTEVPVWGLAYGAASLATFGGPRDKEVVMARMYAGEMQNKVCLDGIQMMGHSR